MKVLIFKDIKNKRWTIWNKDKTKHIGYADEVVLKNAEFVVLEEKRKRVIKTNKRFPHAWIVGNISKEKIVNKKNVTYNPFLDEHFNHKGKKVLKAKYVVLNSKGKVFI